MHCFVCSPRLDWLVLVYLAYMNLMKAFLWAPLMEQLSFTVRMEVE